MGVDRSLLRAVAESGGGVLDLADLARVGLSPSDVGRLIRDGVLERVHRGSYRLPDAGEHPVQRFHAAVWSLRRREGSRVLACPAALSVLGLPLLGHEHDLHVACEPRNVPSARSLMTGVALPPTDQLVIADGSLVCGAARAALDTARFESVEAGVIAADAALRRGLITQAELDAALDTMGGLHGVGRARLCCELAHPKSESPGESWSAVVMHQHRMPRPERQESFTDARGLVGRADFWWPEQLVVGEFDGKVKYGRTNPSGRPPEDVLWDEKVREDRLRAIGLHVVRWTTADLYHPREWIRRLVVALRQR